MRRNLTLAALKGLAMMGVGTFAIACASRPASTMQPPRHVDAAAVFAATPVPLPIVPVVEPLASVTPPPAFPDVGSELHDALTRGDLRRAKELHAKGASLTGLLSLAIEMNDAAIARWLVAQGEEADAALVAEAMAKCEGDARSLALLRVIVASTTIDSETLKAALTAKKDVAAVIFGAPRVEKGAIPMAIAEAEDVASIRRLAARGVVWSDAPEGSMPALVQAATNLDVAMVRTLLEIGAPVEQADGSNRSALASAAEAMNGGGDAFQRSTTIVKLLLDHGASPNRRLVDGRTPIDAAEDGGNDEMLRALRAKGGRASPKKPGDV